MIKVYKSNSFQSQEVVESLIEKAKEEIQKHKTSVGIPAPIINPTIKQIISDPEGFEFLEKTEEEELAEQEAERLRLEQEKREQEKLEAQKTPSEKYSEYRGEEYLPAGEQFDLIYKTLIHLKESGTNIGEAGETLISHISSVKDKYPKP